MTETKALPSAIGLGLPAGRKRRARGLSSDYVSPSARSFKLLVPSHDTFWLAITGRMIPIYERWRMGIPGNNHTRMNPRRLESLGIVELLHPEILVTEMLSPKIAGTLSETPTPKFDTNRAVNTAQMLDSLLKGELVRGAVV